MNQLTFLRFHKNVLSSLPPAGRYKYQSAYQRHIDMNHTARLPQEKPYRCEVCGQFFKYLKSFHKHRANHTVSAGGGKMFDGKWTLGREYWTLVGTRGVRFGHFSNPVQSEVQCLPKMLSKNCPKLFAVQKLSKIVCRPKIVQIFVITHYIYELFPACQMFSDCH